MSTTILPVVRKNDESGQIHTVTLPSKSGCTSRVDVVPRPNTTECDVMAETTTSPDPAADERRKNPGATQVTVQNSGGLTGWPATIANMTAVGFVLLLTFMMYRDFVATVKERDMLIREEMRVSRDEAKGARDVSAHTSQLLIVALQGLQTKMDSLVVSNTALAAEFRAARLQPPPPPPNP